MLDLQGLRTRAAFFQAIRHFFVELGFLEVDTPIRQPALIPEAHIHPLFADSWFLQASPELCMKRLLACGCEHIFQVARCFRKDERGRLHLEEMTLLEWYRKDADYRDLMEDCERLVGALAMRMAEAGVAGVDEKGSLLVAGRTIDLSPPWTRLSVTEAFSRWSPMSLPQALAEDMFDEILVEHVEPHLGWDQPLFLMDYPVELASLARTKPGEPQVAERVELYLAGVEIANGFSELCDPVEQRIRFAREIELIVTSGRTAPAMPERFLEDLGRLDQAAGIALGLDRLLMLFLGADSVARVQSFSPDDF
ncbi:MAG: EF-P lysine aminoacylase GenX [Desulfobulbaceae bacterium]|uniref:EF-P lysine aminoacylase GenX n=1 Tax=Candidatus Desulfatifera sulfidica TaxID=2841691 RepID=A0A8J6TE07_9BACT|nr:EF-P lysine aminoacylase GenX [Candidatus Desulfatifera sulfidica]